MILWSRIFSFVGVNKMKFIKTQIKEFKFVILSAYLPFNIFLFG